MRLMDQMLYNKFRQRTHQSKTWLGSFEEIVKKIGLSQEDAQIQNTQGNKIKRQPANPDSPSNNNCHYTGQPVLAGTPN